MYVYSEERVPLVDFNFDKMWYKYQLIRFPRHYHWWMHNVSALQRSVPPRNGMLSIIDPCYELCMEALMVLNADDMDREKTFS